MKNGDAAGSKAIDGATKVGGRLRGRKSASLPDRACAEERASASLTHAGGADAPRPAGKFKIAKRAVLLEIDKVQVNFEPAAGVADALLSALRDNRYAAWRMVSAWLAWHELAGTAQRFRAGEQVAPFTPELLRAMYYAGTAAAPRVAALSITCTREWLRKTMAEQTSPKSGLPRWLAVLVGAEDWWGFRVSRFGGAPKPDEKLPLRVYSQLASAVWRDGHLWITTRAVKGEDGRSLPLTLRIMRPSGGPGRKKKQWMDAYAALGLVADGHVKMPGSLLVRRGAKWFFALTRDREFAPIETEHGKTLLVRASRRAALACRYQDRTVRIGDEELLPLGRKRQDFIQARQHKTRDANAWWNYCQTLSHRLTNQIVEAVERHGVERVIVLAGRGDSALDLCGIDEYDLAAERTRFPQQTMQKLFSEKLVPRGVAVVTRANLRSVKRRKANAARKLAKDRVREAGG